MVEQFLKWNRENRDMLSEIGIVIDQIMENNQHTGSDGIAVDYLSESCLGRVSVWESGDVDMEVLDIISEGVLLYKHYDSVKAVDISNLLQEFFDVMRRGIAL